HTQRSLDTASPHHENFIRSRRTLVLGSRITSGNDSVGITLIYTIKQSLCPSFSSQLTEQLNKIASISRRLTSHLKNRCLHTRGLERTWLKSTLDPQVAK